MSPTPATPPIVITDQRALRGPNLYRDVPLWRLGVRTQASAETVSSALQATGLRHDASDMGRLIGSLATLVQQTAGIPARWYHAETDPQGDWVVVYEYQYEQAAAQAGAQAIELIQSVFEDRAPLLDDAVKAVREARALEAPSPSVEALIEAARKRDIPVMRRAPQHHQLGWGHKQQHLWGSVPGSESSLGYDIAEDHERVQETLQDSGIPLPEGESCRTLQDCRETTKRLGYPVTVKPLRGPHGLTRLIEDDDALEIAVTRAQEHHSWVYIQQHVPGLSHRVLVVGGEAVAATRRSDHADVTDTLHPVVRLACQRAARLVGIDVVTVDLVAPTLHTPLIDSGGRLVSMNPNPSLEPFTARGAADRVIHLLYPKSDGRIPLVTVTGTNGKTTTVRLIAHILKYAGARVGMAVTGALEVENQVILRGDYSGPTAAQTVLREPGVTHAVCEVARGGILRSGLGYDASDVAVMLNVSADHLGLGGIDTLEDLARLKGVILRATRKTGTMVLNADDPLVWGLRDCVPRNVIPFTLDPDHPEVARHLDQDTNHHAVTLRDGAIVVRRGGVEVRGPDLVDIPLTLDGAARFNVQNAMAATAVAIALGLKQEDIRAGLVTFNPSMNQLPGRMNLIQIGGVKVLVDYGHNVAAVKALAPVIARLAKGRKINAASGAGNRRDEDLRAFGATIAKMYDRIYLSDPDPRGRAPGETPRMIAEGILSTGFPEDALTLESSEAKASRLALAESRNGDLVVLQSDDVDGAIRLCRDLQARLDAGESPAEVQRELLEQTI